MNSTAIILFYVGISLIVLQIIYPFILSILGLILRPKTNLSANIESVDYTVTIVIPVHDRTFDSLSQKLINVLNLNYPQNLTEIIVAADGKLPELYEIARDVDLNKRVKILETGKRVGKNEALNRAIGATGGEIIIISDVDAVLENNAVKLIVERFNDSNVGGVVGKLSILEKNAGQKKISIGQIQKYYWKYESWLKKAEIKTLGSVTSNQGPIMAIRRSIFEPIPAGAADDLFLALSVVKKNYRHVAEPKAQAFLNPPSKSVEAEFIRRRRIVNGSFEAMWANRGLFTSLSTLPYAICLFIHKILRRLTPFILILLLAANGILALEGNLWLILFIGQLFGYMLAILTYQGVLSLNMLAPGAYFWAVNMGMMMGIIDFLKGQKKTVWD